MALTFRTGSGGKGSALTIEELDNNFRHFTGSHDISGSLTISGSLDVVNTISGSSLVIDYDNVGGYALYVTSSNNHATSVLISNLPTSQPSVTGSFWISGSSVAHPNSGYLMVFNP